MAVRGAAEDELLRELDIKRHEMSIAKLISQRGSSQKPTQARGEDCPGAKCDVTSSHLLTLRRR